MAPPKCAGPASVLPPHQGGVQPSCHGLWSPLVRNPPTIHTDPTSFLPSASTVIAGLTLLIARPVAPEGTPTKATRVEERGTGSPRKELGRSTATSILAHSLDFENPVRSVSQGRPSRELKTQLPSINFYFDFACARAKSLQLRLTLCNLMDCSLPGSSAHGILQARFHLSCRRSSKPRD